MSKKMTRTERVKQQLRERIQAKSKEERRAQAMLRKPELSESVKQMSVQADPFQKYIVSDRKVPLTMQRAEHFITLPEFVGERGLTKWAEVLVKCMKQGTFRWESVILSTCVVEEDGVERRNNGHHTCWGRFMVGDELEDPTVKLVRYKVPTYDDFRKLYSNTDQGKSRGHTNILAARLYGTPEFEGASKRVIQALEGGYAFWKYGERPDRHGMRLNDIIDEMVSGDQKLCRIVMDFLIKSKPDGKGFQKAPVYGAMFATFNKVIKDSIEFWSTVIAPEGKMDAKDARLQLREYILTRTLYSATKGCTVVSKEEMYGVCVLAWNAWRKGGKVTRLGRPKPNVRPTPR